MTYRRCVFGLLCGALFTQSAAADDSWYDLTQLPALRLNEHASHASSYDRSGGNLDLANDLGFDSHGDRVLFDKDGAGCITRIWFATIVTLGETLHVYVDGEEKPRVAQPFWSLFSGQFSGFPAPLVGNISSSSGGYVSYVPICHQRSIRVTLSPGLLPRYYNIDHRLFTERPAPRDSDDNMDARAALRVRGVVPSVGIVHQAQHTLQPGARVTLLDQVGSGVLTSLELALPGIKPQRNNDGTTSPQPQVIDTLNGLRVQMYWDDESTPSIDVPVGALFAIGDFGTGAAGGLLAGQTDGGTLYFKFPMPYRTHARVVLHNGSHGAVRGLKTRIVQQAAPLNIAQLGTLAAAHRTIHSEPNKDLTLLDINGSGHVVAVVLSERSANETRYYLEGDERIFIDGLRSPTIHGTGTEDFFNGAWYYNRGVFALPTHGARSHLSPEANQQVDQDATAQFRFLLGDAIPFRGSIRINFEHGPANDEQLTGSTLVLYYRGQASALRHSDTLQVGDERSEAAHRYTIERATWRGARTYTFHGRDDNLRATSTGRAHRGVSRFQLAVDPKNRGVLLRRLLDQSVGKQRAEVWVDGKRAGIWYTSEQNTTHRFREEDFPLPAALTAGKHKLEFEIRFLSSTRDWNEFQYQTLSILMP